MPVLTRTPRIEKLQKLIEADGFNQLAHYMLGEEYLEEGRPMEAGAKFRRVVELNPEHAEAWRMMGVSFEKAGALKEAAAAYGTAAKVATRLGDASRAANLQAEADRLLAQLG